MDDLKIFVNEKEDIEKIDNKIIELYSLIGMKINDNKSGIAGHNKISIPAELSSKYPEITKENKYKYLGLCNYEINTNKQNEEFIIGKIMKTLEELKEYDLNNKSTIKCINVQIMSQIRYYIESIEFSIECLNRIDIMIRKFLREVNYMHITQKCPQIILKRRHVRKWVNVNKGYAIKMFN